MIEIKVNDEIRDVKEDFLVGLTLNQIGWCAIGLVVSAAGGFAVYMTTGIPIVIITWIAMILMAPFAFLAFFTWHELPAGEIAKLFIYQRVISPALKTYGSPNACLMEYRERERLREKEQKKFEKEMKKKEKRKKKRGEDHGDN